MSENYTPGSRRSLARRHHAPERPTKQTGGAIAISLTSRVCALSVALAAGTTVALLPKNVDAIKPNATYDLVANIAAEQFSHGNGAR